MMKRLGRDGTSKCRRLILLISVGWVPPYCDPSHACFDLATRVDAGASPLNVVEDCAEYRGPASALSLRGAG